jgi:hypothetical protein
VCNSTLAQELIVHNTIEYVRKNHKIPQIIDIDPNSVLTNTHIKTFISDHQKSQNNDLKLFYTKHIDMGQIIYEKITSIFENNILIDENDDIQKSIPSDIANSHYQNSTFDMIVRWNKKIIENC